MDTEGCKFVKYQQGGKKVLQLEQLGGCRSQIVFT